MGNKSWWQESQEQAEFWSAVEKRQARRPTLYRYTVQCTGFFDTVYAFIRAHNHEQAVGRAKALYPRKSSYHVVKEEAV